MIRVETKIDKQVSVELSKDAFFIYLIMSIIGGVGLLVYFVLFMVLPEGTEWIEWLMFFVLPLGTGLGLMYLIKRNIKIAHENVVDNIYEFDTLNLKVSTFKAGRLVGTYIVDYADIVNRKETKSYLFLFLSKTSAFAVSKLKLTELQLLEIKALTGFEIDKTSINL